ncbi:hypothetical protein J4573_11480 [Actinomadura barringtoniae]|uniref:Peptidase S53 domain-containing protein n=1 Tax=Actinomadura barringtoniae TaxID=1427535 RepID=A0A939T605_9ACTN|nr:hypothetical protein [Actinomadura barringtoniae]MBO2447712.1 hypothetical protein [Actinomadura barringtoniae]
MHTRGLMVAAAAAAVVAGAAALVPGIDGGHASRAGFTAAEGDSPAAIRQSVLNGTALSRHRLVNNCTTKSGKKTYHLGCDSSLMASRTDPNKPLVTSEPAALGPADFARAFHLPASGGRRGTIGIIDFGGISTVDADLAVYRKTYGLPACTAASGCLKVVGRDGGAPPAPSKLPVLSTIEQALGLETTLDVQLASAACPGCKIVLVQLPVDLVAMGAQYAGFPAPLATALADGTDTAIKKGANAVSMSYILANGFQPGIATGDIGRRLRHPGVAVVASSGDHGYVARKTSDQTWPQELPWVVSVGGVELTSRDGGATFAKRAWGKVEGDKAWWGAASLCSTTLPPANGQPARISKLCAGHRASSDVSAASTGLAIYDGFGYVGGGTGWGVALGTSGSAPYIAGLYARTGTAKVNGPNTLYRAPRGAIEDVTTGSSMQNGATGCADSPPALCVAGQGWDGPTGLGVPNGLRAF